MKTARTTDLKVPTAAQLAERVDKLVADAEQKRLDLLRAQLEGRALAELTDELNRGRADTLATDHARAAGMTFVVDVWPDHPAAGHLIGVQAGTYSAARPCGVRHPFRLADDGVYYADHWVASPVFPAGRTKTGAIVLAFRVGDAWRYGTPTPPTPTQTHTSTVFGFEVLRSLGLRMNPEPLRGSPEYSAEPFGLGDQAVADSKVRTSDELLSGFVHATTGECPWEVPT